MLLRAEPVKRGLEAVDKQPEVVGSKIQTWRKLQSGLYLVVPPTIGYRRLQSDFQPELSDRIQQSLRAGITAAQHLTDRKPVTGVMEVEFLEPSI
jgi:hypothetical protein